MNTLFILTRLELICLGVGLFSAGLFLGGVITDKNKRAATLGITGLVASILVAILSRIP